MSQGMIKFLIAAMAGALGAVMVNCFGGPNWACVMTTFLTMNQTYHRLAFAEYVSKSGGGD